MSNRKQYVINNTDCQCSITGGVLISKDGKTVALNNYGKPGTLLSIEQDATGPYIINKAGKRIDTGFAVAEAWNHLYTGDGPKRAERRDRNVMNTEADNLKWVPDLCTYTLSTAPLKRVEWMGQAVMVMKTGQVKHTSGELSVIDHYHDAATDCDRFLYKPFVMVGKLQLPVDDLMAAASYVEGDPSGMKCPKVLHKDYDMMNFDSNNLEWAELSSVDYQNYIDAIIATCQVKSDAVNAGKDVPDQWFLPPYCPKEYFNWKASRKYKN